MFIVLTYYSDGSAKPEVYFYTEAQHEGVMKKISESKYMEVFVWRIEGLNERPRQIIPQESE